MENIFETLEKILSPRKDIFGYYENSSDEKPIHDPGLKTICPLCGRPLEFPFKTISLMKAGDNKSYFYRTHKACYESADESTIQGIESSLIDNLIS